jgi:hypothetical protein
MLSPRSLLALTALATSLAGCGQIFGVDFDGHARDGEPASDAPGTPPGSSASVPGVPPGTAPPPPGEIGDSDAGSDAPSTTDADSASPPSGPILPLVVGNSSTYSVVTIGSMPTCPSGKHDWVVLDKEVHDGKNAFAVQPYCTGLPTAYWWQSGDTNERDDVGVWEAYTDGPVKDGHRFTNDYSTYEWHDIGTYTVPAGTFGACFDLVDTAGASHSVFCRGVGVVYVVFRTAAGDGYNATLTSKNF